MRDNTRSIGISLPIDIVEQLDRIRGDIPRSKYLRRSIEKTLREKGDDGK